MGLLRLSARGFAALVTVAGAFMAPGCQEDEPPGDPLAVPCGWMFCPETVTRGVYQFGPANGRGVALVDVDGDGWDDLWRSAVDPSGGEHYLMRNLGGTFTPWDPGIDRSHLFFNWSGAWADIDNDGRRDVLLVNGGYEGTGRCRLYRNVGGDQPLVDITETSGITSEVRSWWGASFADIDGDSRLDFALTAVATVDGSVGEDERLAIVLVYRNLGEGRFEEVLRRTDLPGESAKNPVWIDYDADGDPDLFIPTEDERLARSPEWEWPAPVLLENAGGVFEDVSKVALPSLPPGGDARYEGVFSAAAADFDQDGLDDLYLGRWTNQDLVLFNRGARFVAEGPEIGLDMLVAPSRHENTMGLSVGDFTGDGWPDVLIGTGAPHFAAPGLAYCNRGDGTGFERCSESFQAGHGLSWHHGAAFGDLDQDGGIDIFYGLGGHRHTLEELELVPELDERRLPEVYLRRQPGPATAAIKPVGTTSNRDAIGARIAVIRRFAGSTRYYTVRSNQGFQSQHSAWIVIPVTGEQAEVEVAWPSGQVSRRTVTAGDRLEITEPLPAR